MPARQMSKERGRGHRPRPRPNLTPPNRATPRRTRPRPSRTGLGRSKPCRTKPCPAPPHLTLPDSTGLGDPNLTRPNFTLPCRTLPYRTQPYLISPLPDQLTPVERDDSVPDRVGDHALVPVAGTQDVTPSTEYPQVAEAVRASLAADDVVNVTLRQLQRLPAPLALSSAPCPHDLPPDVPQFLRKSLLRHRSTPCRK